MYLENTWPSHYVINLSYICKDCNRNTSTGVLIHNIILKQQHAVLDLHSSNPHLCWFHNSTNTPLCLLRSSQQPPIRNMCNVAKQKLGSKQKADGKAVWVNSPGRSLWESSSFPLTNYWHSDLYELGYFGFFFFFNSLTNVIAIDQEFRSYSSRRKKANKGNHKCTISQL